MMHVTPSSKTHLVMTKFMHTLLLCTGILPTVHTYTSTMGHFFHEEQLPDSNITKETMMITSESTFHWCSLKEECSYVVKDTRNGKFHTKSSEADLPIDKRYLHSWKKVQQGEGNLLQKVPDINFRILHGAFINFDKLSMDNVLANDPLSFSNLAFIIKSTSRSHRSRL